MKQAGIARVLEEMADLLELSEANPFEVRAYRNGARSLQEWDGDLAAAGRDGTLTKIPGIGKGLAAVIGELLERGHSTEHGRLRALFPVGLVELLGISGLGPKRLRVLHREIGIDSLDQLEEAARAGRIRSLSGFGEKLEATLLRGVERLRRPPQRAAPEPSAAAPPLREREPGRLRAGTSGYSFPEWKGVFYPEDLSPDGFLQYYSGRFSTVEINNTFYRFPSAAIFEQWAGQTPEDFVFAIKANQRITHQARLAGVDDLIRMFVERCRVLGRRLGPILFQLPPQFSRDDDRLSGFLRALPGAGSYAIEFRHPSWQDEVVHRRLEDAGVALVIADDEEGTTPRVATAGFCYLRLRKSDYSAGVLHDWHSWIAARAAEGREIFAYFKHEMVRTSPEPLVRALERRGPEDATGRHLPPAAAG
jgi:uncharacterized protein YecE (DUF72 family)